MRSKSKLFKAYNKGKVEDVAEELLKYGNVIREKDWRQTVDRFLNLHSVRVVTHFGYTWTIEKKNGNVDIVRCKAI